LNVIVERAVFIAERVQESESIVVSEIFELAEKRQKKEKRTKTMSASFLFFGLNKTIIC